jgi:mono/diheme cytochrome c family protein
VSRIVLLASLVALPALAANADQGADAFSAACSRCHSATQVPAGQTKVRVDRQNARPGAGPDLTEALLASGYDTVQSWIRKPGHGREPTACDTRQLSPAQLEDLMAYLVSRVVPAGPSRKERLRLALTDEQVQAKQNGVPTTRAKRGGRRP